MCRISKTIKCINAAPQHLFYSGTLYFCRIKKDGKPGPTHECREYFHNSFNRRNRPDPGFFVFSLDDNIQKVILLLSYMEDKLNLKSRSVVYRCCCDGVTLSQIIYIELSPFWLSLKVRSYFLTAALKSTLVQSVAHVTDNPLCTFVGDKKYFNITARAASMFLDGCTVFTKSRCYNWVNQFNHRRYKPTVVPLRRPMSKRELVFFKNQNIKSRLTDVEKNYLMDWVKLTESPYKKIFAEESNDRTQQESIFQLVV